jgi:GntR family phosphonate transport system transcriptional regulator
LLTQRTPIWEAIAASLRGDISEGLYAQDGKLPTEAVLAARFGVNRHTVRQALGALADAAIVHARRGAGVFVAMTPTDYPISRRVRFHQNLTAAGRTPVKDVLLLETRTAHASEADALHLEAGAVVHVYESLSLAENTPVALFRSVFPAEQFPRHAGTVAPRSFRHCGLGAIWCGRRHAGFDAREGKACDRYASVSSADR